MQNPLTPRAGGKVLQGSPQKGLVAYAHQVETARQVVQELGGSAILADEVGLGKTVEAGLVRAELAARGRGVTTLVLAPAGLVAQWREEWHSKFGWVSAAHPGAGAPVTVLSLDAAKRGRLREAVLARAWDLLVVDEAHHLKNPRTQNFALVDAIRRRHTLLLTATPLENRLTELYTLVTLVSPRLFGSYLDFYRQFILAPRTPRSAAALRALLARVMVRHRHQEVGVSLPARQVTLLPISLTGTERTLYERLSQHLRGIYAERLAGHGNLLPILTIQRELCSSPQALAATLEGADWLGDPHGALLALARGVARPAKAAALANLLEYLEEPALVFTEFVATQEMLVEQLVHRGIPAAPFAGRHTLRERERTLAWFRDTPRAVLVATEAGSQGLNLQWCHHVVNYDLPWNPMRIEQRIGRVHRLGQSSACHIYNLFATHTIEEQILHLLHEKIDLFRQVVGELDVILRHLEHRGRSLEGRLLSIAMSSDTPQEIEERLDRVAREFRAAAARVGWLEPPAAESGPGGLGAEDANSAPRACYT